MSEFCGFGDALGATTLTASASTDGILSFNTVINVTDKISPAFDTTVTKTVFNLSDLNSLPQNGVVGGLSMIIFGISPANPLVQPTVPGSAMIPEVSIPYQYYPILVRY
jgi:hypothetical protein